MAAQSSYDSSQAQAQYLEHAMWLVYVEGGESVVGAADRARDPRRTRAPRCERAARRRGVLDGRARRAGRHRRAQDGLKTVHTIAER